MRRIGRGSNVGQMRKIGRGSNVGQMRKIGRGSDVGQMWKIGRGSNVGQMRKISRGSDVGQTSLGGFGFDCVRAAVFDSLADGWDQRVTPPSTEVLSQLIDSIEIDGKTVLDIGCGTGVLLSAVIGRSPERWIACDLSQRMLEILRERYEGKVAGMVTLHADAHSLPLRDYSVDVVLCNGVYPHFHDKRRALLEIRRVLRPLGVLIINHFVGRDRVNSIHGSSESEVLRVDLLPPACGLAELLDSIGFVVSSYTDTSNLYRVTATAPIAERR